MIRETKRKSSCKIWRDLIQTITIHEGINTYRIHNKLPLTSVLHWVVKASNLTFFEGNKTGPDVGNSTTAPVHT